LGGRLVAVCAQADCRVLRGLLQSIFVTASLTYHGSEASALIFVKGAHGARSARALFTFCSLRSPWVCSMRCVPSAALGAGPAGQARGGCAPPLCTLPCASICWTEKRGQAPPFHAPKIARPAPAPIRPIEGRGSARPIAWGDGQTDCKHNRSSDTGWCHKDMDRDHSGRPHAG
jgi:hypothetical protein